MVILLLCKHDVWGRFVTPLENAGNTPTWEENFPFGKIQNIQAYIVFENGSTEQMNVFTVPGAIYLGHKNCLWSEVQFNHVYHLPGEVWAKTIEYDVLSLELNSGERTHFIRPIRGSSDAKTFLYVAGSANGTRAYRVDDDSSWRLESFSALTGPPYGWTHVIYSYYWSDGKGYCTLAVNNEVHEWVATIADPQRSSTWEEDTNWSWEWSSESNQGSNLGKYFANIRAYPDYMTKAQVESVLSGRLDSYLAMLNALPAPATSGIPFMQIGKPFNDLDAGGIPSYAMIYAEQTGQRKMYLDGSWSGAWGASIFNWNFGDGNTGTGRKVSHTYSTAGNYNVTLTVDFPVWYGTGHEIDSNTKTITVRDMPLIMITSPNGSETWAGNSQHNITWSANSGVGSVVLEYSGDWGWTWTQIASGVSSSSGQYSWTVPAINNNTVRIRVREADYDPQDISDADFRIVAQADTTSPGAPGAVRDGTGSDVSSTSLTTQLSANWDQAIDGESGISKYYYAIGSSQGATNITVWTDNGLATVVTKTGLMLTAGTTYYFSVKAENGVSLQSDLTSSDGQLVLSMDNDGPSFSNVSAQGVTQAGATIVWSTDELSTSRVEYGVTVIYGSLTGEYIGMNTAHSVTLTGLLPVTQYHFRVIGRDYAGNVSVSPDYVFTTLSTLNTQRSSNAYPNPCDFSNGKVIKFVVGAAGSEFAEVKIYTLSGKLARKLAAQSGANEISWDGTNENGERVVRGVYLYQITDSNGDKTIGKIAIR